MYTQIDDLQGFLNSLTELNELPLEHTSFPLGAINEDTCRNASTEIQNTYTYKLKMQQRINIRFDFYNKYK